MTDQELRGFLNRIYSMYPGFIKDRDAGSIRESWGRAFVNVSPEDADKALEQYSKVGRFAPTIADIMSYVPQNVKSENIAEKTLAMCRRLHEEARQVREEWKRQGMEPSRESTRAFEEMERVLNERTQRGSA